MVKQFVFRGKTLEEIRSMPLNQFAELLNSRERRSLKRGLTEQQKKLLARLKNGKAAETHCRDTIVLPEMINKTVKVHDGKNFVSVIISPEMLGHRLGEFVLTRKKVEHHAPGIGATRSSASLSVK
jgi:small subunit ribosomal protein S19